VDIEGEKSAVPEDWLANYVDMKSRLNQREIPGVGRPQPGLVRRKLAFYVPEVQILPEDVKWKRTSLPKSWLKALNKNSAAEKSTAEQPVGTQDGVEKSVDESAAIINDTGRTQEDSAEETSPQEETK
jgi:hypothetical protein